MTNLKQMALIMSIVERGSGNKLTKLLCFCFVYISYAFGCTSIYTGIKFF